MNIRNSLSVLISAAFGPYILKLFRWPIEAHHQAGIIILALAAIIYIRSQSRTDRAVIRQVFEAKSLQVDNKYPRLVKEVNHD